MTDFTVSTLHLLHNQVSWRHTRVTSMKTMMLVLFVLLLVSIGHLHGWPLDFNDSSQYSKKYSKITELLVKDCEANITALINMALSEFLVSFRFPIFRESSSSS